MAHAGVTSKYHPHVADDIVSTPGPKTLHLRLRVKDSGAAVDHSATSLARFAATLCARAPLARHPTTWSVIRFGVGPRGSTMTHDGFRNADFHTRVIAATTNQAAAWIAESGRTTRTMQAPYTRPRPSPAIDAACTRANAVTSGGAAPEPLKPESSASDRPTR